MQSPPPLPRFLSSLTIREISLVSWGRGLQRPGRLAGRSDQLPGKFLERVRAQPPDPDSGRIGEQGDDDSGHLAPVVLGQVGRAGNGLPARVGVIDRQDFPLLFTKPDEGLDQFFGIGGVTRFAGRAVAQRMQAQNARRHSAQNPAALETISAPAFSGRLAATIAATAAAPQEMPHSISSSRASRRAISKASSSRTVITSSMTRVLRTSGMNPAPMPWILCGPGRSGS